jgi:dihydrofolate synthase/folylpolyglutamate synthase
LGLYQPRNAAVVISAIEELRRAGFDISDDDIRYGLYDSVWHARFEIISRDPLIIFDGAHNPQGIASATESIKRYFGDKKVYLMTGVLRDKDYTAIAKDLSSVASRAFTLTPDNPRALRAVEYAEVLAGEGIDATAYESLRDAFVAALDAAKRDGVPLICLGSLYIYCSIVKELESL